MIDEDELEYVKVTLKGLNDEDIKCSVLQAKHTFDALKELAKIHDKPVIATATMPRIRGIKQVIHSKVAPKRKGAKTKVLCGEKRWESCTDSDFAVTCVHCLSALKEKVEQ